MPNELMELIAALHQQTSAVTRLAQSNEALVQAMIESEGIDSGDMSAPATYLNGTGQ